MTVYVKYAKCKEELRLTRFRSVEDGTVNIQPKIRPCDHVDVQMQTDPISDKGFGVSRSTASLNSLSLEFIAVIYLHTQIMVD